MKKFIKSIPIVGFTLAALYRAYMARRTRVKSSDEYWKQRYKVGGNSGLGSYNKLAEFKAEVLNDFIRTKGISSVIEYGCGDGNQLKLAAYPAYLGFDISQEAVDLCREIFKDDATKRFSLLGQGGTEKADLTLSLDVIYHLLEDDVFESYMARLFDTSNKYVIVYSSNTEAEIKPVAAHVRHRKFTDWVTANRPEWRLISQIPNRYPYNGKDDEGSFADFYIFQMA
jgi:SAM-dependent methyltransferase